jgi:hypothetical protein
MKVAIQAEGWFFLCSLVPIVIGIASYVSRQLRSTSRLPKQIDMTGVKEGRDSEV